MLLLNGHRLDREALSRAAPRRCRGAKGGGTEHHEQGNAHGPPRPSLLLFPIGFDATVASPNAVCDVFCILTCPGNRARGAMQEPGGSTRGKTTPLLTLLGSLAPMCCGPRDDPAGCRRRSISLERSTLPQHSVKGGGKRLGRLSVSLEHLRVVSALPQRRLTDLVAFSARPAPPSLLLFLLSFASTENPLSGSVHGAVEKGAGQEHNEHAEA